MSSTLAQGAAGVPNCLSGSSPGRLERRVLSEERGKCYKVEEEEEEEGLLTSNE